MDNGIPHVVLLFGGPGNGKTEAVEATIAELDDALSCDGALIAELAKYYHPPEGKAVPRLVAVAGTEKAGGAVVNGGALVLPDLLSVPDDMTAVDLLDGRRVFAPEGADPEAVRAHVAERETKR